MIYVDGHNLIGRVPGLSLTDEEASRESLLRRVAAAKGSGGQRVVVVFDGDRPGAAKEQTFGGVRVVFAPAGRTADAEILRRLAAGNPRAHWVATSDRGLGEQARGLGAGVLSAEAFFARLARRPQAAADGGGEKPEPRAEELDEWLELFSARR